MAEQQKCELCGDPMPAGEEMFKFHGYSGPCPKPIKPLSSKHGEVLAALHDIKCRLRAWMNDDDAGSADAIALLTDLVSDVDDAIAKAEGTRS